MPSLPKPDARRIITRLSSAYPGATTELDYRNAFELLVATVLSAQSTDVRVNQVTPQLFKRYPDARRLALAKLPSLERLIQPTGFFRTKAKALVAMAGQLLDRHGGAVPATREVMVELAGVGRKTANVVLGHALGVPGLPVDRHVLRVSARLGIAKPGTPEAVEKELCARLPPDRWTLASDCLILHGRRVCRPRPRCSTCMVSAQCRFYRETGGVVADAQPHPQRQKTSASAPRRRR